MRVNWFIPSGDHANYDRVDASVWIRCLQLLPYLREAGIVCSLNDETRPADIDVFVRRQDEAAFELARHRKARGTRVVYDLCVDYFDETGAFQGGYGTLGKHVLEARRMTGVADAVTCASSFIAARAREYHSRAVCLPDSIDPRHFQLRKNNTDFERRRLRAIWSGVSLKSADLRPVLPVLAASRMQLVLISDRDPWPRFTAAWWWAKWMLNYRFIPWCYDAFPSSILEGDVCLSPRDVSSPYNRGHSAFKIAAFLAQGVPALASPVPSYVEVLEAGDARTGNVRTGDAATGDGGTGTRGRGTEGRPLRYGDCAGRVCRDRVEWRAAIRAVRRDRELLKAWSRQGPAAVAHLATPTVVNQYIEVFRSCLA